MNIGTQIFNSVSSFTTSVRLDHRMKQFLRWSGHITFFWKRLHRGLRPLATLHFLFAPSWWDATHVSLSNASNKCKWKQLDCFLAECAYDASFHSAAARKTGVSVSSASSITETPFADIQSLFAYWTFSHSCNPLLFAENRNVGVARCTTLVRLKQVIRERDSFLNLNNIKVRSRKIELELRVGNIKRCP